jgi:hypothetical protein
VCLRRWLQRVVFESLPCFGFPGDSLAGLTARERLGQSVFCRLLSCIDGHSLEVLRKLVGGTKCGPTSGVNENGLRNGCYRTGDLADYFRIVVDAQLLDTGVAVVDGF